MENISWIIWFYDPIHAIIVFGFLILALVYKILSISEQIINLYRERLDLPPLRTWYFYPWDTFVVWFKSPKKSDEITKINKDGELEVTEPTLPGHEYDGIRELDNKLPPWWVWGFYLSILWAVVYLVYYHVFPSTALQDRSFAIEMQEMEEIRSRFLVESKLKVDENSVTVLLDGESIEAGQVIYQSKCAPCHAADGGGLVGPNLTDPYWIHGEDIQSIFRTIKNGVPEKGMISWKEQLNPLQIQQVSSFIVGLQGTTPAVAKAPQGDLRP